MKQHYFIFFLFLFTFFKVASQEQEQDVHVNQQLWLDYNMLFDIEDNKTLSGFVGFRTITPNIYKNLLLVSTYNINNQKHLKFLDFLNLKRPLINSYHLGTRMNYIVNKNEKDDFEFRIMQGIKFFLPSIKKIPLKSYLRVEERFQKTFDGSNWDFGFRIRYRISTIIQWDRHVFNFTKGLYIPINAEFFVDLKKVDRFNDVVRISPGLGYKHNDDWKFELYVSYQNTVNTAISDYNSNDFVLRLRIFNSSTKKIITHKTKHEQIKELIE